MSSTWEKGGPMSLQAQLAGTAVKQLLGIESQREQQMNRIEQKVQAGLEGRYRAGRIQLEEACVPGISAQRRTDSLEKAEAAFIDAIGNLKGIDPLQSAWAALHVVGICKIQDRSEDARRWAARAQEDAIAAVRRQCLTANNQIDAKLGKRLKLADKDFADYGVAGILGYGVVSLVGLAAWPAVPALAAGAFGVKKYRSYQSERVKDVLTEVAKFADEVGDLRESLGDLGVSRHKLLRERGDEEHYVYA